MNGVARTDGRSESWDRLAGPWDLIVVGGGITGAGILAEAVRVGLRTLLLEQADFAAGTSSRSSKLVHGGLRYLANLQVKVTFEAVRERERLLRERPGLVEPIEFILPTFPGHRTTGLMLGAALVAYDLIGAKWDHQHLGREAALRRMPELASLGIGGAYAYKDAQTDDARLVLRVIGEGVRGGGVAVDYARVTGLMKTADGTVRGVLVEDAGGSGLPPREIPAPIVVNATGAWADALRAEAGGAPRIRPLRGSHLFIRHDRLPVSRAVTVPHPTIARNVFVLPWEGVTLVGTTDVDHPDRLEPDVSISPEEVDFLLTAVQHAFPDARLGPDDVVSTMAGVRPVVDTGKKDPSKESREHVLWSERGLLTVAGGKLTTFGLMARDALRRVPGYRERVAARKRLSADAEPGTSGPAPSAADLPGWLDAGGRRRLIGRYGVDAPAVAAAAPDRPGAVAGTSFLWGELAWAAANEQVVHLDDLLLRRTRIGLTVRNGGLDQLEEIRAVTAPAIGWDDARWSAETDRYRDLWHGYYALPGTAHETPAAEPTSPPPAS